MIVETLPNTNAYAYNSGNACIVLGPSLPEPVTPQLPDFCICDFIQCEYVEKVFADPLTNDFWKNDKNEFLFKRLVSADTVTMKLYKDGDKVADLNTNAEGTYFNGFPSGNAEQQLYVGYLLDWKLIEALYGVGIYQVKAQLNIIGNVTEFESRRFNLTIFSETNAYETVRVETVQNGNIIGNQFDFTDLDWYGSVRIPAIFGNPTPVYETDRYVTSTGREKRQIKDKMSREWFLKTKKLSWEIVEVLVYNKMMANQILMTDYNILAESVWRRIDVVLKEPDKTETTGNPNKMYNFTCEDNTDIYQKRNF